MLSFVNESDPNLCPPPWQCKHTYTPTHSHTRRCCGGTICIHLRDESLILPVKTLAVIYSGSQRMCHSSQGWGWGGVGYRGAGFSGRKERIVYDKTKSKGVFRHRKHLGAAIDPALLPCPEITICRITAHQRADSEVAHFPLCCGEWVTLRKHCQIFDLT